MRLRSPAILLTALLCLAVAAPAFAGIQRPGDTLLRDRVLHAARLRPLGTTVTGGGNPFATARFFVDPGSPAANAARNATDPTQKALLERIARRPQADWLGEWNGDIRAATADRVRQIRGAGALPVFVVYAIPGRDCGYYSSGGIATAAGYRTWIRSLAAGLDGKPAAIVLEPDALGLLDARRADGTPCLTSAQRTERLALLADAVHVLSAKGASVYIDAGNARWQPAETMARWLRAAGVGKARGFALNTSNFHWTADNVTYGQRVSSLTGGEPFIIDTSRNGLGPSTDPNDSESWCNPPGRGLGAAPTGRTGVPNVDAYFWVKRPGESDGTCKGGPAAGGWWQEYALGLARRAVGS